jgi:hypothetical protein
MLLTKDKQGAVGSKVRKGAAVSDGLRFHDSLTGRF